MSPFIVLFIVFVVLMAFANNKKGKNTSSSSPAAGSEGYTPGQPQGGTSIQKESLWEHLSRQIEEKIEAVGKAISFEKPAFEKPAFEEGVRAVPLKTEKSAKSKNQAKDLSAKTTETQSEYKGLDKLKKYSEKEKLLIYPEIMKAKFDE